VAEIRTSTWIGLIRAIGPSTHKKMSMQQLREGCNRNGFENVRTVLATGNVVFSSGAGIEEISKRLTDVLVSHGLGNKIFLRRPGDLEEVVARNPFADAAEARPNHLLVLFLEMEPSPEQTATLLAHQGPERMAVVGREVFIDYVEGVGRSKLTPAVLERSLQRPGTARNWNTVGKLIAASR